MNERKIISLLTVISVATLVVSLFLTFFQPIKEVLSEAVRTVIALIMLAINLAGLTWRLERFRRR